MLIGAQSGTPRAADRTGVSMLISRRMHPSVCRIVSWPAHERRLALHVSANARGADICYSLHMHVIPMFDVIPVTGTARNGSRFCLVCALGSAPVMVAFVKRYALGAQGLLAGLQHLSDKHNRLQVVVVCLAPPSDDLREEMKRLAEQQRLTIPLALLPAGELPASLGIDPACDNAVLLYRGRRIQARFGDVDLRTFDPLTADGMEAPARELDSAFTALVAPPARASDFEKIDWAAAAMSSGGASTTELTAQD